MKKKTLGLNKNQVCIRAEWENCLKRGFYKEIRMFENSELMNNAMPCLIDSKSGITHESTPVREPSNTQWPHFGWVTLLYVSILKYRLAPSPLPCASLWLQNGLFRGNTQFKRLDAHQKIVSSSGALCYLLLPRAWNRRNVTILFECPLVLPGPPWDPDLQSSQLTPTTCSSLWWCLQRLPWSLWLQFPSSASWPQHSSPQISLYFCVPPAQSGYTGPLNP